MGEVSSCKLAPPTLRIDKARKRENKSQTKKHNKPGCCFSIPTMLMIVKASRNQDDGLGSSLQAALEPRGFRACWESTRNHLPVFFFPLNELIREDRCQPLSQYALRCFSLGSSLREFPTNAAAAE